MSGDGGIDPTEAMKAVSGVDGGGGGEMRQISSLGGLGTFETEESSRPRGGGGGGDDGDDGGGGGGGSSPGGFGSRFTSLAGGAKAGLGSPKGALGAGKGALGAGIGALSPLAGTGKGALGAGIGALGKGADLMPVDVGAAGAMAFASADVAVEQTQIMVTVIIRTAITFVLAPFCVVFMGTVSITVTKKAGRACRSCLPAVSLPFLAFMSLP
eukprot:SAG22_NODE_422_length_10687_cov_4.448149_6_plen_213_part_00